jgi:gentisate 1,2-dioxygenase
MAYRWEHTDAALTAQLELEDEGHAGVVEPGHAVVRFTNPATAGDCLSTMRCEMHRLRAGSRTALTRTAGSAVWQVFEGSGVVAVGDERYQVGKGDLFCVPSWAGLAFDVGDSGLDAFRFSDEPVFEALGLARTAREARP